MKTIIASTLALVLCCLTVSCSVQKTVEPEPQEIQESKYKSVVCDTELNSSVIDKEVFYWSVPGEVKDLKDKQICYEGENYNLTYISSSREPFSPYEEDEYYDGDKSHFSFRSDTDEMTGYIFNVWGLDMSDYVYDPLTIDAAQTIAENLAEKYIKVEDYAMTSTAIPYTEMNCDEYICYRFIFTRHIGGIPTKDYMAVTIGNDGRLISFRCSTAGLFSGKDNIEFDKEEVEKSIALKINELFLEKYEYVYTTGERLLTYTPNGELILLSVVRAGLTVKGIKDTVTTKFVIGTLIG
ncbi:MAG: hypothetical protein IKX06_05700 [Clostridia bacterium]|nr:hypothetical protein [Clostridia bacterium]